MKRSRFAKFKVETCIAKKIQKHSGESCLLFATIIWLPFFLQRDQPWSEQIFWFDPWDPYRS